MRVGGTVQNTLKGGGTEKRRGETKSIKSGKLRHRVGALKRGGGGLEPPFERCRVTISQNKNVWIKGSKFYQVYAY